MAIINRDEFGRESGKFLSRLDQWLSDSVNYIFIASVVWGGLIITSIVLLPTAVYGINAWWDTYSVANPGAVLESMAMYWAFIISTFILKATLFLQTIYTVMIWAVYLMRPVNKNHLVVGSIDTIDESEVDFVPLQEDIDELERIIQNTKHIHAKNKPICPKCKRADRVIKKGTRQCYQRYLCKRDMLYFRVPIN